MKNVKGEKGISGCAKIFCNQKEYKELGSRQQRAGQAGIIIYHIVSTDGYSQVHYFTYVFFLNTIDFDTGFFLESHQV